MHYRGGARSLYTSAPAVSSVVFAWSYYPSETASPIHLPDEVGERPF